MRKIGKIPLASPLCGSQSRTIISLLKDFFSVFGKMKVQNVFNETYIMVYGSFIVSIIIAILMASLKILLCKTKTRLTFSW